MSDRSAEIRAAYDAAVPSLGAGHALESRLIGPAAYAARLSAARDAVNDAGLDAVVLGFGADMRYLTGYVAPALERLTALVVPARGEATLIVPRLEAGMAGDSTPGERIGVVIGTANAGIDILEIGWKRILGEGKKPMPLTIPMTMGNAPASRIAREIGARGPVFAVTTACASASHAMLLGLMLLRNDLADVMVVGGTDSCFNSGFLQAWDGLRVVSPTICRPFSKDRQGLTIGEGAGIIVLEKPGRATARGARNSSRS